MKILTIIFILSLLMVGCSTISRQPAPLYTNTYSNITTAVKTPTPYVEAKALPKTNSATVISEHANLHKSASQKSDVIDVVPQAASVEVIKQRGAWFLVKTETLQGWMHGNTLQLERYNSKTASTTTTVPTIVPQPVPTASPMVPKADHSGATARCRDGSLSYSAHRQGTCSHHGGVAEWF
jgi:hypothetical protein